MAMKSSIFSATSCETPFSTSSFITFSLPILSNLSTALKTEVRSSMSSEAKNPFNIFLLFNLIVKLSKPRSLKVCLPIKTH